MDPAAPRPAPFLFGKLPTHGDFVARGLGEAERRAWDDWASGLLAAAGELGQEGLEAAHEAMPPWRFVLGPGGFGPGWRAGGLAASIDSAGRRFFIIVGVQGLDVQAAAARGALIADQCVELIYRALGDGLGADALSSRAQILADTAGQGGEGVWWSPQAALVHPPAPRGILLGEAAALALEVG